MTDTKASIRDGRAALQEACEIALELGRRLTAAEADRDRLSAELAAMRAPLDDADFDPPDASAIQRLLAEHTAGLREATDARDRASDLAEERDILAAELAALRAPDVLVWAEGRAPDGFGWQVDPRDGEGPIETWWEDMRSSEVSDLVRETYRRGMRRGALRVAAAVDWREGPPTEPGWYAIDMPPRGGGIVLIWMPDGGERRFTALRTHGYGGGPDTARYVVDGEVATEWRPEWRHARAHVPAPPAGGEETP